MSLSVACRRTADEAQGEDSTQAQINDHEPHDSVMPDLLAPQTPAPHSRIREAQDWLDLIAQRPLTTRWMGKRMVIDFGDPSARVHQDLSEPDTLQLGVEAGEDAVGLIQGHGVALDIPLDGSLHPKLHPSDSLDRPGLALAITLRALAPKQVVTVLWNERPLANLQLDTAWERRTLSIPADLAMPGENRLRLYFRKTVPYAGWDASALLATVEVGPRDDVTSGPVDYVQSRIRMVASDEPVMGIPRDAGLVYYVPAPRRGRLRVRARGEGSIALRIDQEYREQATTTDPWPLGSPVIERALPLTPRGREHSIDLSAYAGRTLRIELKSQGAASEIEMLQLDATRDLPVDRRPRTPRRVIVFAIEGARADDVYNFAKKDPRFPNFERVAKSGLVFARAYSMGSAAVPSHAALLSSVQPVVHLTDEGTFVAESQVMFPELFVRAELPTAVWTANEDFNEIRGLAQGFSKNWTAEKSRGRAAPSERIVRQLIEDRALHPEASFLYLNVNDPQAPYDPPLDFIRDIPTGGASLAPTPTKLWIERVRMGKIHPGAGPLAYVRRLYRGELQAVDRALGQLLDELQRLDQLDSSVIVVVGVHGEEFLEHAGAGHGRTLFEESIRVPLIIHAPQLLAPGLVDVPVDLLDLAPTLADLLGFEPAPRWQGRSLVPIIDDPAPPPQMVISQLGDGSRAGIVGAYKLIVGPGTGRRAQSFYDLSGSGGEHVSAAASHPYSLRMLRAAMAWQLAHEKRWRRARWGTPVSLSRRFALDLGL